MASACPAARCQRRCRRTSGHRWTGAALFSVLQHEAGRVAAGQVATAVLRVPEGGRSATGHRVVHRRLLLLLTRVAPATQHQRCHMVMRALALAWRRTWMTW